MLKKYLDLLDKHPELSNGDNNPMLRIVTDIIRIQKWQEKRKEELRRHNLPPEWANIGVVLEDPYLIVLRDLVQFPSGSLNGYTRIIPRGDIQGGVGVAILPIFKGKVLLLYQFRHSTRKWHLEVPRGYGEPGMPADENARKEIWEETGGRISNLIDLGSFYPQTGFDMGRVRLYFAQLESIGFPEKDEGIARFVFLTISELEKYVREGKVADSFTIACYAKAKLLGLI